MTFSGQFWVNLAWNLQFSKFSKKNSLILPSYIRSWLYCVKSQIFYFHFFFNHIWCGDDKTEENFQKNDFRKNPRAFYYLGLKRINFLPQNHLKFTCLCRFIFFSKNNYCIKLKFHTDHCYGMEKRSDQYGVCNKHIFA